jgi:hypothetical protein
LRDLDVAHTYISALVFTWRKRRALKLRDGEIEGLIQRGWLARERRTDVVAIRRALYNYLSDNLGDAQWARPKPVVTRNVRNRSQK